MRCLGFTVLTAITISGHGFAAEPVRIGFDDLPKLVAERNQHVSGAKAQVAAAEAQTGHLSRSYLPSLEFHAGGERFKTGALAARTEPYGAIETKLNLFRSGKDLLEENIRQSQVVAAGAGFQDAYAEEMTKARKAYWELVYQREVIALLREAAVQTKSNLVSANQRIGSGLATETDRIEFEMYSIQLEQDIQRLTLGAANSQRNLNVLIGLPEDSILQTVESIPHEHDDSLFVAELNPSNHREIRSLLASHEVVLAQKTQARLWWAPSLDLYGSYSLYTFREREYDALSDRRESVVGLRLTLNVFDGFQNQVLGKSLSFQAEGIANRAAQRAKELKAQFEGAKLELKLTHDLIHNSEKSVEQAQRYLSRTQSEYKRGVKNSPDVASATEKYIDMRRRYAEMRKDYQMARAEFLAILGK